MSRTMPTECEHGTVIDWGDFGPCQNCDEHPGSDDCPNLADCPRCQELDSGGVCSPLPDLPDECYPLDARPIPVRRPEHHRFGLGRRWEVYRCWQGIGSTLVPQPTGHRYWRRKSAERMAGRLTTGRVPSGAWFEVRPVGTTPLANGRAETPGFTDQNGSTSSPQDNGDAE